MKLNNAEDKKSGRKIPLGIAGIVMICALLFAGVPFIIMTGTVLEGDSPRHSDAADAAAIDASCKAYYSDIILGKTAGRDRNSAVPLFPELGENESDRREFADSQGNIRLKTSTELKSDEMRLTSLSGATALGELYGNDKKPSEIFTEGNTVTQKISTAPERVNGGDISIHYSLLFEPRHNSGGAFS